MHISNPYIYNSGRFHYCYQKIKAPYETGYHFVFIEFTDAMICKQDPNLKIIFALFFSFQKKRFPYFSFFKAFKKITTRIHNV